MLTNPRPTRAEVSDVANAVLDGTDAVMLSGETAAGKYPVEAVQVMARVARQAEAAFDYHAYLRRAQEQPCETVTDAIAEATVSLAEDLCAQAIITPTSSGATALKVARHRPQAPVVAVANREETQRRLALVWGVYPLCAPRMQSTDELVRGAVQQAVEAGFACAGDRVIVTAGVPSGVPGRTNLIKVEVVGEQAGVQG
jgi:pyruvate kinase